MASLKTVALRIKSVGNIGKITSAMKMVSSAKFKLDERRMNNGLPFCEPFTKFFDRLPSVEASQLPDVKIVALSSDKGMCGGINSGISKNTRLLAVDEEKNGANVGIMCVGNKSVSGLKRLFGDRFNSNFEECQIVQFNFTQACMMAEDVNSSNPGRSYVVYNKFHNMVTYECIPLPMYTKQEVKLMDKTEWSKAVDQYNFEPGTGEVWDDLHEFYYATTIFGSYLHGIASEQSARMAAMENASKNAGEIVDKLTLVYNRGRQAKITTELCEIISGASAL